MVKSPAVTREMVQELVETGSVQPPIEVWGEGLSDMLNAMGRVKEDRVCVTTCWGDFEGTAFGILAPVAQRVISLSGTYDEDWDTVRRMEYTMHKSRLSLHRDPVDCNGALSVLFTKRPRRDDRLLTGGRANECSDIVKSYNYRKGPIILAQAGFGASLLTKETPSGGTWHAGHRSSKSRFGVVDFFPPTDTSLV